MQTSLADFIADTHDGQVAESILRKCVHCGFCTATCPTYQLLGDELDGPRGRIYLIKQALEGEPVSQHTQFHLDRCLTCRSCETTCPSGVQYGRLVDIGRDVVESRVQRPLAQRAMRYGLRMIIPYRQRFQPLMRMGQVMRSLLPGFLRKQIPQRVKATPWPMRDHARRMLVLDGCAQPALAPQINSATARLLDSFGIRLETATKAGCCGAVCLHTSAREEGLNFARRNIDAWWPFLQQGAEAIVMTASGCGVTVRDYAELLEHDPDYAEKAKTIAGKTRDLSEVVAEEAKRIPLDSNLGKEQKVAFHSPCSLQHGQQIHGVIEKLLVQAGFNLVHVADSHLCCGSAGTYSILQPKLSQQLLDNKLNALQANKPDMIATANIGCLMHLGAESEIPTKHWVELLMPSVS